MSCLPMRHVRKIAVAAAMIVCATRLATADSDAPRAVAAWLAGPMEVRIALDRPVQPDIAKALVGRTIRVDESARGLESLGAPCAPPFSTSEGPTIAAARLEDDGRTLVLTTDPHPRPAVYFLAIPPRDASGALSAGSDRGVPYDLSGVDVRWSPGGGDARPAWVGWWPELSPDATRAATRGSVEHERGLALLAKPGRLTLSTLISLPPRKVSLRIASSQPIVEGVLGGENGEPKTDPSGESAIEFTLEATDDPIDLSLTLQTGHAQKPLTLNGTYRWDSKPPQRVRRGQLSVPWAPGAPAVAPMPPNPPDLAGGDPKRGEAVFFGDAAKCANCHQVGGKGGKVGPDLTDVFKRPLAEVYRDVAEPSTVIRAAYVPYTLALKDGRVLAGIVRAEGASAVRLTDTEAKVTIIPRADIEEFRPSATSVMPVGLVGAIGEANLRDLMAFLMKPKP